MVERKIARLIRREFCCWFDMPHMRVHGGGHNWSWSTGNAASLQEIWWVLGINRTCDKEPSWQLI